MQLLEDLVFLEFIICVYVYVYMYVCVCGLRAVASYQGFVDRDGGLSQTDLCCTFLVGALIYVIILSMFNVTIFTWREAPFRN